MNGIEAWKILTEEEQNAINLSIQHGKSTWQAGEILKKSHYKYLEILDRAKTFLRIFTLHYKKYGTLIPAGIPISQNFKLYLAYLMEDRVPMKMAVKRLDDKRYIIKTARDRKIYQEMFNIINTNNEACEDLFQLIMEFDRWNNFRILPEDLQEPSAFKRRAKARFQKYLKNLTTLPSTTLFLIKEKYKYGGNHERLWVALVNPEYKPTMYQLIPVKNTQMARDYFGKLGLPMYREEEKAIEFGQLIAQYYLMEDKKTPRLGQKFWQNFRLMLKDAINYESIEHIKKTRAHILRTVDFNDKALHSKSKTKQHKLEGEKRVDDDFFHSK